MVMGLEDHQVDGSWRPKPYTGPSGRNNEGEVGTAENILESDLQPRLPLVPASAQGPGVVPPARPEEESGPSGTPKPLSLPTVCLFTAAEAPWGGLAGLFPHVNTEEGD